MGRRERAVAVIAVFVHEKEMTALERDPLPRDRLRQVGIAPSGPDRQDQPGGETPAVVRRDLSCDGAREMAMELVQAVQDDQPAPLRSSSSSGERASSERISSRLFIGRFSSHSPRSALA